MNKLAKIILIFVTIVLASNLLTVDVDAAKKAKEYKATADEVGADGIISSKKGEGTFANGGTIDMGTGREWTIYYNFKSGTTKTSKVKAPTMMSKKVKPSKDKKIKIKKDSVIKFKAIKGKVTKAKFKKAKTYYFVCKVQKTPFAEQQTAPQVFDKVTTVELAIDNKACDKVVYTKNGEKSTKKYDGNEVSPKLNFYIDAPTTIQVTGYKLGKKLGTYTYKYDVQKYTHSERFNKKLQGEFPKPEYCHESFYLPYGEGYALSYTLDGSTPTLNHGTFVENPENDDVFKRGYTVENTKDCELTLKVQYFEKTYVKNDKKYQFAGYQPYGKVLGGRFTMISTRGTWSYLSDGNLCATESFRDTYNFIDYQCTENLDYAIATWLDNKGYIRTQKLMPGERISEYSEWGALEMVQLIAVKNGKMESRYKAKEVLEISKQGFREDFLTWEIFLASYEVYEKGLPETEFPRLTPKQTYADSSQMKACPDCNFFDDQW